MLQYDAASKYVGQASLLWFAAGMSCLVAGENAWNVSSPYPSVRLCVCVFFFFAVVGSAVCLFSRVKMVHTISMHAPCAV